MKQVISARPSGFSLSSVRRPSIRQGNPGVTSKPVAMALVHCGLSRPL
jgi:hypothetical protein